MNTKTKSQSAADDVAGRNAMTQHTPGPWRAVFRANQKGMRRAFVKMGRDGFWELHKFESINEIDKANARLIAAAPELYEAVKELIRAADDGAYIDLADVHATHISRRLRAAIGKAEGAAAARQSETAPR